MELGETWIWIALVAYEKFVKNNLDTSVFHKPHIVWPKDCITWLYY